MAIIIPESKIHNYNFNILQNNFISNVYANIENIYNFENTQISIDVNINTNDTTNYSANWSINSYSDFLSNVYIIPPTKWNIASTVPYTVTINNESRTYYKIFHYFQMDLQVPEDLFYVQNTKNITNNIKIKATYTDNTVEEGEAQISYTDTEQPALSSTYMGLMRLSTEVENYTQKYKHLWIYCHLPGGIGSSIQPLVWVKSVKKIEIIIEGNNYKESTDYAYNRNYKEIEGKFTLSNTKMFDKNIGQAGLYTVSTPIYELISSNIINNYRNGKMTLDIETRYTTFKDNEGNYINEGKPYLIKVGDIVKPEMTNKFKNFQYEYLVTSAEYEYTGSDKVYLKLLQIN